MDLAEGFARFFARRRGLVALGIVITTAIAAWGNFGRVPNWRAAFDDEPDASMELLAEVNESLSRRGGSMLLVVESDDLFTPRSLAAVRRVEKAVESLDAVSQVIAPDDVPQFNVLGLPVTWMPAADDSPARFAEARRQALAHPLIVGQLLAEDGRTLLMPVVLEPPSPADFETPTDWRKRTAMHVRQVALDAAGQSDVRVRATGRLPLFVEQSNAFERDHVKFLVIGSLLAFVLAGILFRGAAAVLIVAGAPMLGVFWTLGALHIWQEDLNQLADVIMPIMLIMVGFTDGIHLMVDIRRARAEGVSPVDASTDAIRHLGSACFLTSLTTAIGFGSLTLADSEVIQSFGRSCAVGVVLTFAAVITVVPLLCSTRLGRRVHAGYEHDIVGKNLTHFQGAVDWIIDHARTMSAVGILVTAAFTLIALNLRPDNTLGSDFPSSSESYQALAHCDRAFGGIQTLAVVLDWSDATSLDEAQMLATIDEVTSALRAEPLVRHPFSIRNVLLTLSAGNDENLEARLPLLRLFPQNLTQPLWDPDARRAVVTARVQDLGMARYLPVFDRLRASFAPLAQQHAGLTVELSGDPVVTGREIGKIIADLRRSLATAAAVILIVIGLVYRSLRLGLISVVPNLFPLVFTATLLVVMGRPLEIESVCAFTICLGIAVDDTIHFLSRYQREVLVDRDVRAAIRRSFIGVATALMMSTVALVSGFGAVLTSELPDFRLFAAMACSTIGSALVINWIFLPALLSVFAVAPRAADTLKVTSSG